MTTTLTTKGQVTIPKELLDALGLKPGDEVEMLLNAAGGIVIQKPGAEGEYRKRLLEVANRRIISGMTTDEIMEMTRGYSEDAEMEKAKP